jgi:CRP-like cAMP-binding protein
MEGYVSILTEELGYTAEHVTHFESFLEVLPVSRKEVVNSAGNICSFIGFLEKGVLRSYILKEGDEFTVDFFLPGSFVSSYTSFLTRKPANTSIQALTDSLIYCLSYENYTKLLDSSPQWYLLAKFISDSLFMKKCRREKSLLMDSAADRYSLLIKTYPQIEQLVTQYHIASYLGIQPESLSRIKSLTYIKK